MKGEDEFEDVVCATCGCTFYVPMPLFVVAMRNSSTAFWCPYGHQLYFKEPHDKPLPPKEQNKESPSCDGNVIQFPNK